MPDISIPMDNQGYVQYYAADSLAISDSLFTERELINLGVQGGFGGGAQGTGAGCNIAFDALFNIDLNLDPGLFDFSLSGFDPSMFHKVDSLSLEMAAMNNMLIDSILDMQCCDIAGVYNTTMVPFFKFFAEDGGFMTALVTYAEVITVIRAIMEPLECLMRLVPGNPWFPYDFDYLAWIYGYFKESKPFINRILSGEIIDIMLNPVHNMRVKMQACLGHGVPQGALSETFTEIGTADQLAAISQLAASSGNTITDAAFPYMPEPHRPKSTDAIYIGGETNPLYAEHLKEYDRQKIKYDIYLKNKEAAESEIKRQSSAQLNTNKQLVLTSATQNAIRVSSAGLCGCIADAFDINDFSVNYNPIRTTSDLFLLDGETIKGLTNQDTGTSSTHRPPEDQYSVSKDDLQSQTAVQAIVNAGSGAGAPRTTDIIPGERSTQNPYSEFGVGGSEIITEVQEGLTVNTSSTPIARLKNNDKSQITIQKLTQDAGREQSNIDNQEKAYNTKWNATKKDLEFKIRKSRDRLASISNNSSDAYQILAGDINLAVTIFNSYFKQFPTFDMLNDPKDQKAVSNYIVEEAFLEMYPPEYWDIFNGSPLGSIADQVRISTNNLIVARGTHFAEVSKSSMRRQSLGQAVDLTRYNLMNNIASNVPSEVRLEIPCTCDNLLCRIINYVIQYVLALFDKLIQEIIAMIIQFLIPDWIRDLLRTLSDFLKCFLSAFNIFHTIGEIHHYSERLLESLRGRINLYPADPCFIPDEPFAPLDPNIPGDNVGGISNLLLTDDNDPDDGQDGQTYIPGTPGPGFPNDQGDPGTPSIILNPGIDINPGDQGRPLPAFALTCTYLEL